MHNFQVEILAEFEDRQEAEAFEKQYIEDHDLRNPLYGYNIVEGGGEPPTDEASLKERQEKYRLTCLEKYGYESYESFKAASRSPNIICHDMITGEDKIFEYPSQAAKYCREIVGSKYDRDNDGRRIKQYCEGKIGSFLKRFIFSYQTE